ncbi:putative arginine repressor, partial [Chlamydia psittaci 84-8471/1]
MKKNMAVDEALKEILS